jgi:hypothetical protein
MILGVLSVVSAASQQQHIGVLNKALDLRMWLSRGKTELDKRRYRMQFSHLPLESSVAAIKLLYMPKVLLNLAVLLYTVGFGIYLLYSWIYHAESEGGRNDFRNIFIAFVATVGLVYLNVVMVDDFASADERKRTAEFNLDRTATFAKPVSQKQLEEWLQTLHDMQSTTVGVGELYAKLETAVNDLQTKWESERIEQEKRREEHLEAQKRRRTTRVATGQA